MSCSCLAVADGSATSTLLHFLHPLGGFSGGPANTQLPHLLPTYASTCSLAMVGNSGPGGGWEQLAASRQATYDFFMRCKQPDGGFVVCEGGEVDVRCVSSLDRAVSQADLQRNILPPRSRYAP